MHHPQKIPEPPAVPPAAPPSSCRVVASCRSPRAVVVKTPSLHDVQSATATLAPPVLAPPKAARYGGGTPSHPVPPPPPTIDALRAYAAARGIFPKPPAGTAPEQLKGVRTPSLRRVLLDPTWSPTPTRTADPLPLLPLTSSTFLSQQLDMSRHGSSPRRATPKRATPHETPRDAIERRAGLRVLQMSAGSIATDSSELAHRLQRLKQQQVQTQLQLQQQMQQQLQQQMVLGDVHASSSYFAPPSAYFTPSIDLLRAHSVTHMKAELRRIAPEAAPMDTPPAAPLMTPPSPALRLLSSRPWMGGR